MTPTHTLMKRMRRTFAVVLVLAFAFAVRLGLDYGSG